jgi:ribosomal-protein-alanine N-acetyltransferase
MIRLDHSHFYLRTLSKDDAELLLQYELKNRDAFEATSTTRSHQFYTLETQTRIAERCEAALITQEMIRFIVLSHDHHMIGTVSLNDILWTPNLRSCFLGYSTDLDYQSKGITTQAVALVIDYAFNTLNLHRIEAGVMPTNIASQRVLEKNGFKQEGLCQKNVHINGRWEDHYLYGLINPRESLEQ